jgi:pSer/pThr/pTyr-binding forkhead associated (FHA) protein
MLFVPPLPPLQLPGDGATVVMGRSRSCELRLPDADTSRRHAKIVCEGGAFVVHDLASTNGTWVNGQRVEEHVLRPGDRIQIGANTITFCQVDSGLDLEGSAQGGEAETILVERPSGGEVFQGDLAEIPPFAVLQILEMGRKTGVLNIDSDGSCGRLWFSRGDPVHAETKDQAGFDAAIALVNASRGRFTFEPQIESPAPTIEASVTQLLLEASRLMDEENASAEASRA